MQPDRQTPHRSLGPRRHLLVAISRGQTYLTCSDCSASLQAPVWGQNHGGATNPWGEGGQGRKVERRGHFRGIFHKYNQKVGAGCGGRSDSFPGGQASTTGLVLTHGSCEEQLSPAERGLKHTAAVQHVPNPVPFTPPSQRT